MDVMGIKLEDEGRKKILDLVMGLSRNKKRISRSFKDLDELKTSQEFFEKPKKLCCFAIKRY